ncbi:MAG: YajD family HNH nuclease [Deltaproteobacteria bacterium]|jgi:5-methylcytosine-specific restriction endonuclease McrA|nr:YajD family HNH nuclease [Deltaproteobacteria bacterium]
MSLKSGNNPNLAVTEALSLKKERENSYRGKALKLFPWICGHCGREFEGKRLKELTVHHKDHNHDNNPPDGSNWELLCIYCHDNEHSRDQVADALDQDVPDISSENKGGTNPFAGLGDLLKGKLPE